MRDLLRDYFQQPVTDLKARVEELELEVGRLTAQLRKFSNSEPPPKVWKVGERVKGNEKCGFHRSMHGVVVFCEPSGNKVWVWRDGASSPCYFHSYELDPE